MVERFESRVKELIPDDVEKEKLFEALRRYQSNHDLHRLLADLRTLLNEPNKLELYDFMRPLILLRHQIEYSKRTPADTGVKIRTVRLMRVAGESLGFAVRGGYEHGVGIFVTEVTPGSQADRQGLRVGDEVVRVNGFTISEAIHDDVLNLIKSRDEVIIKVTYIGMLPVKDSPSEPVVWQYVKSLDEGEDEVDSADRGQAQELKIFIDSTGHASIGCSILSESGHNARFPGIFVEKVHAGSIAEQVGLEAGDQILEVNETSFRNITWREAVLALKSSRQLNLVIRKKAGFRLVQSLQNDPTGLGRAGGSANQKTENNNIMAAATIPQPSDPDNEPIYSVVNKPAKVPSPEASERRTSRPDSDFTQLDESELIQQQLNMKPLFRQSAAHPPPLPPVRSPSPTQSAQPPPLPPVKSPSPTQSARSSVSSVVSTAAEVHIPAEVHTSPSDNSNFSFGKAPWARTGNDAALPHSPVSPIGGAAAVMAERRLHSSSSNTATLLGPQGDFDWTDQVPMQVHKKFRADDLNGRPLQCLTYKKTADLGVDVEGGMGSPLGGKILVAMVFDRGIAQQSGKLHVGDQLMMINGQKLLDVTSEEAEKIIQGVADAAKDRVELYFCKSTLVNDEDSVTYF